MLRLLLITLLISCVTMTIEDRGLQKHLEDFMALCYGRGACEEPPERLHVRWDILDPGIMGECRFYETPDYRIIAISSTLKGTNMVEQVMFHELGHCWLGLGHWDDDIDLMNTFVMSPKRWARDRDKLIDTFFDRVNDKTLPSLPYLQ